MPFKINYKRSRKMLRNIKSKRNIRKRFRKTKLKKKYKSKKQKGGSSRKIIYINDQQYHIYEEKKKLPLQLLYNGEQVVGQSVVKP